VCDSWRDYIDSSIESFSNWLKRRRWMALSSVHSKLLKRAKARKLWNPRIRGTQVPMTPSTQYLLNVSGFAFTLRQGIDFRNSLPPLSRKVQLRRKISLPSALRESFASITTASAKYLVGRSSTSGILCLA
jgi:hypothetical protein